MDIIRHELKNIFVKASYNGSIEITTGMLVEKHNHIITFSENIDKLFSFVAMLQVFTNTSLICFLGLIALTVSIANILSFRVHSNKKKRDSLNFSNCIMK